MGILTGFSNLLSPKDPELVQKTLARIDEQDKWNDVFSTKLIEILDNIDLLKREHRQRLRDFEGARIRAEEAERLMRRAEDRLLSSEQRLEQASELARISEQRHCDAVNLLRTVVQCAVWAVAFSWIAMAWLAWIVMGGGMPGLMVFSGSMIVAGAFVLLARRVRA